jgi:hypothetical protein
MNPQKPLTLQDLAAALPDFAGFLRAIETGRPGTVDGDLIATLEMAASGNQLLQHTVLGWINEGMAKAAAPGLLRRQTA